MKYFISLVVLTLFFVTLSRSQTVIKWQNTIGGDGGDALFAAIPTMDGGFIIGGYSSSYASCDKSEDNIGFTLGDYWVVKLDALGNIQWENTIGGNDVDWLYSIDQTADGGYVLGGASSSGISVDKTESSKGGPDYWIVKLNSLGSIEWQKTIGGNGEDDLNSIHKTNDGGYILGGVSSSTTSGDKTDNGYGFLDYWIVKVDSSANIQWQKTIGGSYDDQYCTAEPTADGGYIVGGLTKSGISGNKTEDAFGGFDFWIIKLDSAGNIEWQNSIGGNHDDEYAEIHQTNDGGYILGGTSYSDISFDKTEGCLGQNDYWILKLDSVGNIIWQNTIGGSNEDEFGSILQTSDGGYIAGGVSRSDISFDKSENCNGEDDYWIVKLDSIGNVQWQNTFGGNSIERKPRVFQTSDGEYFAAGWTYSNASFDKIEDNCWMNGTDFWVLKLTETYNLVKGKLFFDLNSNSIQDADEPSLSNHIVTETNTGRFSFSHLEGDYAVSVLDTGDFLLSPSPVNYYLPHPSSYNISFTGINEIDSLNDFAFQPAGEFNDLTVVLTPLNDPSPGFDLSYNIDYANVGTTTLSGTIVFYLDPNLEFDSASVTPDIITADSIVWNIGTLSPLQAGSILVTLSVDVNAIIGSSISSSASIRPSLNDADVSNNHSAWDLEVIGSYDPNEILVNIHSIDVSDLLSPPYLEYIINFQNTGTDTAINIKVNNKIPFTLDMTSFQLVASSSPVEMVFDQATNKIEFHLNDIMLPDSNVNEPASHGFLRYRIKPLSTLSSGDSIVNNASIFFDFNAFIKTNDAVTHIILATSNNEIPSAQSQLRIFPNPSSDKIIITAPKLINGNARWRIVNMCGQEVFSKETFNDSQIEFDISKFEAGIYFIQFRSLEGTLSAKLVKQ